MTPWYADVALAIGRSLVRDAIWSGDDCTWVGSTVEVDHGQPVVALRSLGADVYGGTAGIALFLATLARENPEPPIVQTARGGLATAKLLAPALPAWSFYSGRAGVAWAIHQCGELLGDNDLMLEGLGMLLGEKPPDGEAPLDAVSGLAGCIAPLLRLYLRYGDGTLLEHAVACGRRIAGAAERAGGHASWRAAWQTTPRNLTGYSHGIAGIALPLLQLAHVIADDALRQLAHEAFRYEHDLFDSTLGQWVDVRQAEPTPSISWCYGAAGIGLSRVAALQLERNAEWEEDVQRALAAVGELVANRMHDFSLCHGLAGIGELFLTASRIIHPPSFALAEWIARIGAEQYHRDGHWPSGIAGATDVPGLLLGRAGIGHFYARLAAPQQVPSLLCLSPYDG